MAFAGPGLPSVDPAMGYFDFSRKGDIDAPGSGTFAPFDGFSMGPGRQEAGLSMGPLGADGATYRSGGMAGWDATNQPIVAHFVTAQEVETLKQDCGVGQLLFASNPRTRKHELALKMGKTKDKEPEYLGEKEPLEFRGLSRYNRWLKSREGRLAFGKERSCQRLKKTYRFAGVQFTPIHDNLDPVDRFSMGVIVQKRARIPDVTGIDGKGIQPMDRFFLVYRRYEWEGVTLPDPVNRPSLPEIANGSSARALRLRQKRMIGGLGLDLSEDGEEESKAEIISPMTALKPPQQLAMEERLKRIREIRMQHVAEVNPDVMSKAAREPLEAPGYEVDASAEKEYYWQLDVEYHPDGITPNPETYLTNSFDGDIEDVGLCTDLHGDRDQPLVWQTNAKEALHPTTDTDEWKKALIALPQCDLMIRI